MSKAKQKTLHFGKRGREQAEPGVPRVTVIQRRKTLGAWYLHATGLQRKVLSSKDAFKASRPRP